MVKFQICSRYSGWDEIDEIAHLQSCLCGPAEQLLWADGQKDWTYRELVDKLTRRFGSKGQTSLYRAELNTRNRQRNESLLNYFQDVSRLVALAYEGPRSTDKDTFAVEYFLRGMGDHEISAKVRELEPQDLDEAFRHAVRFESYSQLSKQNKNPDDSKHKAYRDHGYGRVANAEDNGSKDSNDEMKKLTKELEATKNQLKNTTESESANETGS